LNYGNSDICDFRILIANCKQAPPYARGILGMGTIFRAGNRDAETGITPMDNFVCWRCERDARGAFMLMGRPAGKWLVERQGQMELALAAQ